MAGEKEKAVVILGTRDEECEEINLVKELGYKSVLINKHIGFKEALLSDYPLELDLNDEDAVISKILELQKRFELVTVFTLNEYRVPLCAKLSEKLGVSTAVSYNAALNCRNKKLTRQILAQSKWPVHYKLIKHEKELLNVVDEFDFPVIVKPSDESASSLVARCDSLDEAWEAVAAIRKREKNLVGQDSDSDIIVEEYLEGAEYSVEAYTIAGKTQIVAITEKLTAEFNPAVEVGHIVPAVLSPQTEEEIRELVKETLALLNVEYGVTHTEVKLTKKGPRIIEVNARPGGDHIPDLVKATTGIDLRKVSLWIALGVSKSNLPIEEKVANYAGIRFLAAERSGMVFFNQFPPCKVERQAIFVKSGQSVSATTSNLNRLGYFIVHASKYEELRGKMQVILNETDLRIQSKND
ncbi:ATP-grasp domain-containing protein [Staphylospora marina]|uniref:ATP-grasp domain-containing protein n=1 Tax=Staphylospora marina TaxID=2490858 RepID=UPI000F5B955A|nr:ATP-grasp domain-containing protein [Staphylospora marina]